MHSDSTTRTLVERLRAGDARAFETLFRAHYPDLFRFAQRQLRDEAEAEDVIQDVFLRIWRDRERLAVERSLRAFLLVAVRNRVIDRVRRRMMERDWITPLPDMPGCLPDEIAGGLGQTVPTGADPAAAAELREAIQQAVAALPDRCRATFLLCREHGLSYVETAEVMAVTPGTVKTQMGRALASLRRALEPFLVSSG